MIRDDLHAQCRSQMRLACTGTADQGDVSDQAGKGRGGKASNLAVTGF